MPTTYLITGANRGIGLEFARQLSARGEKVFATAREPAKAKDLAALPVTIIGLDVSDTASLNALGERMKSVGLDVLINNAGIGGTAKSIESMNAADLSHLFAVNSIAPVMVAKALFPSLRAGSKKTIINISSQLASLTNNTGGSTYDYRASKTALNMLTSCLSNELKASGFTCIAFHPGWVKTDMGGPGAPLSPPQAVEFMLAAFARLTPADTGKFLNYDGKTLPW